MSKQTAVEWLLSEIQRLPLEHRIEKSHLYMHALKMEREQIVDSWHNGYENQSPMIDEENCGQQYYNETYKGGEQ